MKLYHGTNLDIEKIDLLKCRPYKDFGTGFYLTEIEEQAAKMAKRVSRIYGGDPVVNVYEVKDDYLKSPELNILQFGNDPTPEWAQFVMNNRNRHFTEYESTECNFDCKYDIVPGPIANDDMALLFRQYQNNLITFDTLTEGLTFREVTHQISFHTERAIAFLEKAGVL